MPGAITGRCRCLHKSSAFVHLFAKLVFFSFSKPNHFLPIVFIKEKWTSQTETWMAMMWKQGRATEREGLPQRSPKESRSDAHTSRMPSSQRSAPRLLVRRPYVKLRGPRASQQLSLRKSGSLCSLCSCVTMAPMSLPPSGTASVREPSAVLT